ncbi:MAG: hypothetical protein ABI237_06065 [Ginsengibacter sp.]
MKQQLESKGWVMYYQCKCSGGKQYFINEQFKGYEVIVGIPRQTFKIQLQGQIISGPSYAYQLADKLAQYVK